MLFIRKVSASTAGLAYFEVWQLRLKTFESGGLAWDCESLRMRMNIEFFKLSGVFS